MLHTSPTRVGHYEPGADKVISLDEAIKAPGVGVGPASRIILRKPWCWSVSAISARAPSASGNINAPVSYTHLTLPTIYSV